MTKGRAVLPVTVVAEQEPYFLTLGRPKASVEKHFPRRCTHTYAPVEMTRGRLVPPSTVVAEQEPFFITLGGPQAHDPSVEKAP